MSRQRKACTACKRGTTSVWKTYAASCERKSHRLRPRWRFRKTVRSRCGIEESRNRGIEESRNRGIEESRNRGIEESRNRGIEESSATRYRKAGFRILSPSPFPPLSPSSILRFRKNSHPQTTCASETASCGHPDG